MRPEEAVIALPLRLRVRRGLSRPANWLELVRFGVVGASGYALNLAVFAAGVHAFGLDYRLAAVVAFAVALANNFFWNRRWTFAARGGRASFQVLRFIAVSIVAFAAAFAILQGLVDSLAVPKLLAQAISIVVATPLNFLGNKLWSFRV